MSAEPSSPALRTPIRGPSAFTADPRRFLALTLSLAVMEFKVRFFGSVLGYLWQLVRPLLLFGVLYVVFTEFVRFNAGVPHFPISLLAGIVLFTFFSDATAGAVTSVLDREGLVRKIQFPRLVVPLSVVTTAVFNLAVNFVAVMVFVLASGVAPSLRWLLVPIPLLVLALLATGVATLLSALYVRFRDVRPIWEVVLQLLFYASPILYAIEVVPNEAIRRALMLNPIGAVIQQTRHWLVGETVPSAAAAAGGVERLVVPASIVFAVFGLGLWYFAREAPRIAEEL